MDNTCIMSLAKKTRQHRIEDALWRFKPIIIFFGASLLMVGLGKINNLPSSTLKQKLLPLALSESESRSGFGFRSTSGSPLSVLKEKNMQERGRIRDLREQNNKRLPQKGETDCAFFFDNAIFLEVVDKANTTVGESIGRGGSSSILTSLIPLPCREEVFQLPSTNGVTLVFSVQLLDIRLSRYIEPGIMDYMTKMAISAINTTFAEGYDDIDQKLVNLRFHYNDSAIIIYNQKNNFEDDVSGSTPDEKNSKSGNISYAASNAKNETRTSGAAIDAVANNTISHTPLNTAAAAVSGDGTAIDAADNEFLTTGSTTLPTLDIFHMRTELSEIVVLPEPSVYSKWYKVNMTFALFAKNEFGEMVPEMDPETLQKTTKEMMRALNYAITSYPDFNNFLLGAGLQVHGVAMLGDDGEINNVPMAGDLTPSQQQVVKPGLDKFSTTITSPLADSIPDTDDDNATDIPTSTEAWPRDKNILATYPKQLNPLPMDIRQLFGFFMFLATLIWVIALFLVSKKRQELRKEKRWWGVILTEDGLKDCLRYEYRMDRRGIMVIEDHGLNGRNNNDNKGQSGQDRDDSSLLIGGVHNYRIQEIITPQSITIYNNMIMQNTDTNSLISDDMPYCNNEMIKADNIYDHQNQHQHFLSNKKTLDQATHAQTNHQISQIQSKRSQDSDTSGTFGMSSFGNLSYNQCDITITTDDKTGKKNVKGTAEENAPATSSNHDETTITSITSNENSTADPNR